MRVVKLLVATGLGFLLAAHATVVLADSTSSGKAVIKTTLSGRANFYPPLRNWFKSELEYLAKLTVDDRYPEAVVRLRKLVEEGGLTHYEMAKAQQTLATYYYVLGNYQQAYDATVAAVSADGLDNAGHLQAMYREVQLLAMMERYEEAAGAFDKYQKETPKVAGSEYVQQAGNFFYRMDYKAANQYMDKAFATGDKPERNWYQFKATSLLQGGDYAGAVAYCKEQLARQPDNSQWSIMLVDAYMAQEKYQEALAVMNDAKAKGRGNSEDGLTRLYQLYARLGRQADAVDVIDQGLASGLLKADIRTLNAIGQLLFEAAQEIKGKPEAKPLLERAIVMLNQSVALDPADGNAEFWLGQIAVFAQDDNRKARDYFVAATGKKLKHPGLAWYYLGGVEDHLDHTTAAKAALAEALKDPESKAVAESYLKGMK